MNTVLATARTLFAAAIPFATLSVPTDLQACTGITLCAKDGAVVYGRTMEWGTFDLKSRVVIVPRGHSFTGHTPDDKPGMTWKGRYGVAGLDGVERTSFWMG